MVATANLPIHEVLPDLITALQRGHSAILIAPPGAGKTTIVPGALRDAGVGCAGKTLVIQPRRIAAMMVARRIAAIRGVKLGQEVGYQIRFDKKSGPKTEIELLTEGMLLRRLQSDPFLEGVGTVILDEFHERSLGSDTALALLAEIQREVRPELKLLVMSATLDPAQLVEWFDQPPAVIASLGRMFPIETIWGQRGDDRPIEVRCAAAVRLAIKETTGDVLAFLPGVGWIHRTADLLSDLSNVDVFPLYGSLSASAQDKALSSGTRRRVVLSTNIAESSVTVAGVTAVVDSGLQNQPKYLPKMGTTRLETVPISQASADQRAGRAGRLRPGRAYRLWTKQQPMRPYERPEVLRAELASTLLQIYAWGSTPTLFRWFEPPPEANIQRAKQLLISIGAVTDETITEIGRRLSAIPLEPRLGRVVLAGAEFGVLSETALAAALISEPDPWPNRTADLFQRMEWVYRDERCSKPGALKRIRKVAEQLARTAEQTRSADPSKSNERLVLRALVTGFTDRVGLRRGEGKNTFLLASGTGARLDKGLRLKEGDLLIATSVTGARQSSRNELIIREFLPVPKELLSTTSAIECRLDPKTERVTVEEIRSIGAIVLKRKRLHRQPHPEEASRLLAEAATASPPKALNISDELVDWLNRLRFLERVLPKEDLPKPIDPVTLIPELAIGRTTLKELRQVDLLNHLQGSHPWTLIKKVKRLAPTHIKLPSGGLGRITYPDDESTPFLSARIQQCFGMTETPTVAGGEVKLLIHLLAPNNRPAQITADIGGFWENSYPDIRKELRGRYPKHAWPEHPTKADAQNRPRRKS